MPYSRPSVYPNPPRFKDIKDAEDYANKLYRSLVENDRTGEQMRDRAPSADLRALIVRPEWYGAKCDGVTDDTAAVQAAINAAGAKRGLVSFAGSALYYRCASSLSISDSWLTLKGNGFGGIGFDNNTDGFIIAAALHDVTFDGLNINGSGATGTVGIKVTGAGGVGVGKLTIRNCYFETWGSRGDATGAAIRIASDCVNLVVESNTFSIWGRGMDIVSTIDSGWIAYNIFGQESGGAIATDWAISAKGGVGAVNLNIIGNNCVASGGFISLGPSTAIPAEYAGGVNILYNEFEAMVFNPDISNAKSTVIYLGIGTGYNVTGNHLGLHAKGDYGVYIEPAVTSYGVTVCDNRIDEPSVFGIKNDAADVNFAHYRNNKLLTADQSLLYAYPDSPNIVSLNQSLLTTDGPNFNHLHITGTGVEKLTDGGLEAWDDATHLTNWVETLGGTSTINREAVTVHGGAYSCRMDIGGTGSDEAVISAAVTLTVGLPHRFSIYYKTEAGKTVRLLINDELGNVYLNSAGQFTSTFVWLYLAAAPNWTEFSMPFVTHASYTNYVIAAMSDNATSSSLYFDDISITDSLPIGGPSTFINQSVTATATPIFAGASFTDQPRTATSLYRRYYHIPLGSSNPGASGATWVDASANSTGGWQLNAAGEKIRGGTDIHSDWDGGSDFKVEVRFMINAAGALGTDTVDLKLVCYYKGVGDVVTKTQTVEAPTTVGAAAQYTAFKADFAIDWNAASNVVEVGDHISFYLNLETATSEVDDVTITGMSYSYLTTHIGIEDGDE